MAIFQPRKSLLIYPRVAIQPLHHPLYIEPKSTIQSTRRDHHQQPIITSNIQDWLLSFPSLAITRFTMNLLQYQPLLAFNHHNSPNKSHSAFTIPRLSTLLVNQHQTRPPTITYHKPYQWSLQTNQPSFNGDHFNYPNRSAHQDGYEHPRISEQQHNPPCEGVPAQTEHGGWVWTTARWSSYDIKMHINRNIEINKEMP